MTGQLQHAVTVRVEVSDTGTRYWRAFCRCGFKSARYVQHATALTHAARHHAIVEAGEWRTGGAA